MNKGASSNFQLEIVTMPYNATNYKCIYKTSGTTTVSWVAYYSIAYDETAVQETQNRYIDAIFRVATSGVLADYSLIATDSTNYHAGINTFNFSNTNGINFNFSTTNYSISTSTAYLYLNFSTWNNRIRTCPDPYIYFLESQNLCYDICPDGYYTNATYNFCTACHYSCMTCTGKLSTNCVDCTSTRTLSSTSCPCSAGYYDAGVADC